MSGNTQLDRDILRLLGDEHVQDILCAASESTLPAKTLAEDCDASLATVYRRIERLVKRDLLVEKVRVDDSGNHYNVYQTGFDHVGVDVEDGQLNVRLTASDRAADRFTNMWDGLRGDED